MLLQDNIVLYSGIINMISIIQSQLYIIYVLDICKIYDIYNISTTNTLIQFMFKEIEKVLIRYNEMSIIKYSSTNVDTSISTCTCTCTINNSNNDTGIIKIYLNSLSNLFIQNRMLSQINSNIYELYRIDFSKFIDIYNVKTNTYDNLFFTPPNNNISIGLYQINLLDTFKNDLTKTVNLINQINQINK